MLLFRIRHYLIILITTLVLPGCNVWNNFTTYFNLYYNTSDIFVEAENQIKEQKKDLFSTEELTLPGTVNTQLVKVIEKCSEILQFNSESAYVDEALLMLGKAFYYQKNHQKALRKFEELIATQKESDLLLETKLWIGKTQIQLKDYESALKILGEVREQAVEEGKEDILKDAYVEEIVYRISKEDYQLAVSLSNQFLEVTNDEDIKAEVLFEIGKLYNKINEPENAVTAFEKVLDYNPLYKIELGAKLELGKTLRSVGKLEEALEVFNDMKEEAKFIDAYNEIDLQVGITLKELGRLEEAVEKLTFVDTSYVNTPSSGIAKYKLGEIYEYDYKNFDSAGSYYQKSLTSSLPKDYTIDAGQKIRTFKKYQHLTSQINNYSSQLFYVENPEEYTKDSITFVQDSIVYVQDSLAVLEELTLYSEHLKSLAGLDLDTVTIKDTVAIDSLKKDSTMAGLNSAKLDSIKRKEREIAIKNEIAKQGINIDSLFAEKWDAERKFPAKPIKSALSEDSLKSLLVKNEIELGNLFLTEMERFDSAYYYYDYVLTYYPNTAHQANALYALGSYYLNTDQKEKADSIFNIIYENYRNESIVNAAANRLNKPLIDLEFDPAKDIYAAAESELLSKDYESSLYKFYSIYEEYPKSSVAPKALYTSGWILENDLKLYDSAAVIYDTLAIRYPQSEYTIKIRPKLNAYKQYQTEVKKAIEDSLKRIEQEKMLLLAEDSLEVSSDSTLTQIEPNPDEISKPDIIDERINKIETPDIILPTDTTRTVILNNPRRNPRKK
ncbi:MAG: hypothetical protein A2V93_08970 [Ignavibacteria bacterium RBG_16_34_14]|nr:MAG: hypothetical protein A2V93_08970 [Ignavibacteria bacterium RBG_16_34_14]